MLKRCSRFTSGRRRRSRCHRPAGIAVLAARVAVADRYSHGSFPRVPEPHRGDLAAFKDDVIDGPVGEAAAHRESAMAAAQHDGGCLEYLRPPASRDVDNDVAWVKDVEDRGMLL